MDVWPDYLDFFLFGVAGFTVIGPFLVFAAKPLIKARFFALLPVDCWGTTDWIAEARRQTEQAAQHPDEN
jgi:hypothetical protein